MDTLEQSARRGADAAFAAGLNYLLRDNGWARERLAPFAAETVEILPGPLPALRVTIAEDGTVRAADAASGPGLRIRVKPEALGALARGEEHFMRAVEVNGNARLATEVMALARHLRWDAEEDLSRVVGDIAAHRIAGVARSLFAWQRESAARTAEHAVNYAVYEAGLIVDRSTFEPFAAEVARLRDALARAEQRLERLRAARTE